MSSLSVYQSGMACHWHKCNYFTTSGF